MISNEEITNYFLYGQKDRPSNLVDDSLIRPKEITNPLITVDVNEYMTEGPGRFANPAQFNIVRMFFSESYVPPGTYTEQELRKILGTNEAVITERQWQYSDATDDYGNRVYVWNTVAYEVDDSAKFVVSENGERYIEHFAIIPYSSQGAEDFDFVSRDGWGDGPMDARKVRLIDILEDTGAKSFKYLYDFGDGWEHSIKIEKIMPAIDGVSYPCLIEASGACPPEDSGGPWGFMVSAPSTDRSQP